MKGTASMFKRISMVVLLVLVGLGGLVVSGQAQVSSYVMSDFSSVPINLTESATPLVMINASNDNQLFFKAYNDYSDLDGDGTLDTTYDNDIDYYGYFDSYKCYAYDAGDQRFEPRAVTATKYCTAADGNDAYWSGNFLNWASMTRIDTIRKILFGGHRRVDTKTSTVLERAFLPPDIHSFAKFYDGSDVADLTPYTPNTTAPTTTSGNTLDVSGRTTSSSSVAIIGAWAGTVTLTAAEAGRINNGDLVTARVVSDPDNKYMWGTAAVAGTAVTITVQGAGGVGGTYDDWEILPIVNFFPAGGTWEVGDYIRAAATADTSRYMEGFIYVKGAGDFYITVAKAANTTSTTYNAWTLSNLTRTGITLCNTTYHAPAGGSAANDMSQNLTEPPLIRVVQGNYSFWASGEVNQCLWEEEEGAAVQGTNYNNPAISGIYAYQDNPSNALRVGDFVARVQACVSGLEEENCKHYPFGNYKPIGLLQTYGDDNQLWFGMVAGTYGKARSGGDIVQKIINSDGKNGMCREINLGRDCDGDGSVDDLVDATHAAGDGTFKLVYQDAGGPETNATKSEGIINTWSLYRIYGYDYDDWDYTANSPGDKCYAATQFFGDVSDSECSNWGNPFSEIYLTSLRYFGGLNSPQGFQSGDGQYIEGINYNTGNWYDPVTTANYCARLYVVNFNSSVSTTDADEVDSSSTGLIPDLGSALTSKQWTDVVGATENIHGNEWFVGENGTDNNRQCTAKTVGSLGDALGLCPEGAGLKGSYRIAGLAYYAHTHDIRPEKMAGGQNNPNSVEGTQKVDTFAVKMASGAPLIEIPVPGSATGQTVTILPACINNNKSNYGCTLVDFKILEPHTEAAGVGHGKFLAIWEDSLQGNDNDLDAGGTIEYSITGTQITVTTAIAMQNLSPAIGHGYGLGGTETDGLHFHSGVNGFVYTDATAAAPHANDCSAGCNMADGETSNTYNIGSSSAGLLEDPLWYAAKWGGFIDSNGNDLPDLTSEWDSVNNDDGSAGSDGIPDNYFYASNPVQLENALNRAFLTILQRTSSGTAAAVVSNNVSGEGALYQAYFEPQRQDDLGNTVDWIGTLHALWLDSYGYLREDRGVKGELEDYDTDKVIETYYDEVEHKTRVRRYSSIDADTFTPYAMKGTVTAYDATTGVVALTVSELVSGTVGDGPFTSWKIASYAVEATGSSTTSLSLAASGSITFTAVKPSDWTSASAWISVGDELLLFHFDTEVMELDKVGTIWNAREQLSSVPDATITTQRGYALGGNIGRYITTWIDADLDGVVDAGENIPFAEANITAANYGFFDMATEADTETLVNYIRGKEDIAGYRSRSLDYDGDTSPEEMRLGDIVNSTPTLVSSPQESFDLLYGDSTYKTFKSQYKNRRHVIYVGANDGMLHAFNAGFYDNTAATYSESGFLYDGTTAATEYELGTEIWAYVPMNLLPHLKWLKDNNYTHVYYVDGKPRVFDAKIFGDARYNAADHPGGWGTVLVASMRFGGGPMTIDTAANGLGNPNAADDRTMTSAYVLFDITNPEVEPTLLAEIPVPNGSFSEVYPTVATIKDKSDYTAAGKWYLVFGSGPSSLSSAATADTAKLYVLDLDELVSPGSTANAPAGCSVGPVSATSSMDIITCDTGAANLFVGSPVSVDWDQNYKADTLYFGLVGDANATTGKVFRFPLNEDTDPANWTTPSVLLDTSRPVYSAPTPGVDEWGNHWVFFGSGRLFVRDDETSTALQYLYGVKDPYDSSDVATTNVPVLLADMAEVTSVKVYTDGTIDNGPGGTNTLSTFESYVDSTVDGWYLQLPLISGTAGTDPATRNLSQSSLLGGVLFSSVYQPSVDPCSAEGFSRLYGLYYKTGTAYSGPTVFGTEVEAGGEVSVPFINLGRGFATAPAIHSGTGEGSDAVSVFTQLSTGTIFRQEATTVHAIRSGKSSWKDKSVE